MSATENAPRNPTAGCPVAQDFDPFDGFPHEFYEQARKEKPVFYHEPLDAYVVTRYRDCERILKAPHTEISATAALEPNVVPIPEAMQILQEANFVPAPSMVDEDGETHRMHRAASHPPFRPEPVRQMADFVRRNVNERLDPIMGLGEADIVDAMIYEVPAATILHMMGVPDEQMGMIKDFRGPWGVFGWGYPTEEQQIEVAKGMGEFGAWARQLSDERRANPGDDLVSGYIQHLLDNDADDPDFIRSYTLNVVMAGHETTTNTTAGGIISLLSHRDQWELLCREPEWCANAADEILRHDTGVPTWRQRAVQDIEVSGVTIPAGAKIYCALVSANRDEEIFGEDSMTFDVTRKNAGRHMAFGTGAHTCLGNHLAKLEIKIMLEELTRRLPHMELVPDQEYTFSPNTSQRGPEHVLVQWDPAQNPVD